MIIMDVQRDVKTEAFYFDFIKRGIVDGILVLFTPQTKIPAEYPVLVVSEYQEGLLTDTISLNSHRAGYMLAAHLIQQGHRKIAYRNRYRACCGRGLRRRQRNRRKLW